MLINMVLIDGTQLNKCAIFQEHPVGGQENIIDKNEIEELLKKIPWGRKYVAFQNEIINGHVHVNNVDSYSFANEEFNEEWDND